MGQTDLDKLVGNEPEDLTKKAHPGTPVDRVSKIPGDDLMPEKAMPMANKPVPFKITGGGNGG